MGSLVRTMWRLAAVLAIVVVVAGLTAGGTLATQRPEADSANTQIGFCIEDGGEADSWIREDGGIAVSCEFDDYLYICHYSEDNPNGACIFIGKIAGGDGGSQSNDGNPFHTDERATTQPTDANDKR